MAIWRTMFELSSMSNNQEMVLHTTERIPSMTELGIEGLSPGRSWQSMYQDYADEVQKLVGVQIRVSAFSVPRRLFSRQVLPAEVEQGLDVHFNGCTDFHEDESKDEKAPELTRIIDALTKMLGHISDLSSYMKPEEALVNFLAGDYYDCMSGGSSRWALAMVRELVTHYNIDLTTYVYPASEEHEQQTGRDHHNIADFLEDIKCIPLLDVRKYLPAGLPALHAESPTKE